MRKHAKKRWCAALCAAVMLLSLVMSSAVVYADEDDGKDAARKAAQEAVNNIQKEIDAKKEELKTKESELANAKKNTSDTKTQLNLLHENNALLQEKINLLSEQIERATENIALAEEAEKEQYALFCQQVRQEEERGSLSYWSVLFRASGIADLVSRIDFINEIIEHNQQIRKNLQDMREELQDEQDALEEQKSELDEAQEVLQGKMDETYSLLAEYRKTQEGLQAEYDMIKAEEEALDDLMAAAKSAAEELGLGEVIATAGGYAWPLKSVRGVTSHFGGRASPGGIGSTNHKGVDLAAPMNTPVYAAKAGTVTWSSWNGGYGNCVIVSHGTGNSTLYGHLNSYSCQVGDVVAQGQLLGYSGTTGNSTGPHLHFGIMENDTWIDPLNYLSGWYYCG